MDFGMRDIERALIGFNLVGSVVAGYRHEALWFPVAVAAFGLYVVVKDRALRRQIGDRAWPSEGFARFSFNTNLNFGLTHLILGALLFAVAGTVSGLGAA
jgi:hypothetical protein